jgi:5-hydroxyisourate hydrolase
MSGLTTHVLDLVAGAPGQGIAVRLFDGTGEVAALATDGDGRARLLEGDAMTPGAYRLEFDVGPYFRAQGLASGEPGFFETVTIGFNLAEGVTKLHVPLLVSPHGYSTYRGS